MAFKNCPLKSINLENVEIIEQGAFIRTKLTEADLTNTTRIDYQAFSGCNLLADVVWPKNLEELRTGEPGEIGSDPTASKAFENCTSLRNVVISGSITDIPDEAFIGCTSLESIILPEGLTSIGDSAFALLNSQGANPNPQLKSINIPSTVTSLGDHFLGGLKADGETLLISQVTDPSIFTEDALAGISGDGVNAPTIYYPTEAKEAYTAESSPLKDMLPLDEATEGKQDYMLELPESAQVKVDESLALAVAANLPEGATVNYSSGDSKIATVDNGTITGVAAGSTTITASISLNGVVLATDECMVTVTAAEIPADTHSYVSVVTKPTCTEQGYTTHICEICGDSYVDSYTEPIGHSFAAAWSHDANGHWKECERCGIKVDAAAHTFQWVTDKEATASETGSKHEECVICGYKKAALEIPATGTSEDPSEPSKDAIHSPQTGDDNNLALWIAVLVTTGAALIGTTLYNRKRKYN